MCPSADLALKFLGMWFLWFTISEILKATDFLIRPEDVSELLTDLIEDESKNGAVVKIHLVEGKVVREEATLGEQPLNYHHPGSENLSE